MNKNELNKMITKTSITSQPLETIIYCYDNQFRINGIFNKNEFDRNCVFAQNKVVLSKKQGQRIEA